MDVVQWIVPLSVGWLVGTVAAVAYVAWVWRGSLEGPVILNLYVRLLLFLLLLGSVYGLLKYAAHVRLVDAALPYMALLGFGVAYLVNRATGGLPRAPGAAANGIPAVGQG